jgi:hypothetical protein
MFNDAVSIAATDRSQANVGIVLRNRPQLPPFLVLSSHTSANFMLCCIRNLHVAADKVEKPWNPCRFRVVEYKYSAYNHKRATAAKCRESHHRRHDCTLAIGERHSSSCIRSAVVWLTAFCSGGALMIVRTVVLYLRVFAYVPFSRSS